MLDEFKNKKAVCFAGLGNPGNFYDLLKENNVNIVEQIENLLIEYLKKHDIITVAEFRELAQTSRKYAVPFLEFCDDAGLTVRNGNYRKLRKTNVSNGGE